MANPTTVRQALTEAPIGTQWYAITKQGTFNLRKKGNGQFVFSVSGQQAEYPANLADASTFYNAHGLNQSNNPEWVVKPAPKAAPKKQVSTPPPRPAPAPANTSTSLSTVDSLLGPEPFTSVSSSSTITIDPAKLSGASLKDDQSIRVNPTRLANTSLTDPLKDNQSIIVDPAKLPPTETAAIANLTPPSGTGLSSKVQETVASATAQDQANFLAREDWRVRLSLAPGANYLYKAPNPGILAPLAPAPVGTDGVIFPYTPSITVNYAANYEPTSLTHTNYKIYQYQGSGVDQVQITGEFTAQDVKEANYVLAVIHFFRTMTKMFYGKDESPKKGTPPPLCYLFGMGAFQFDALPLAITSFNYSLPQDVDYIKTTGMAAAGTPQPPVTNKAVSADRLGPNVEKGGKGAGPNYGATTVSESMPTTWVPTKIQLSITCVPIMSRNQVSNYFSLKDYADGTLIRGTTRQGGAFW